MSNKNLKPEILRLRAEGKTYSEISKFLGCTKSIISYHCNPSTNAKIREKMKLRKKELSSKNSLLIKIDTFKHPSNRSRSITGQINREISGKVTRFHDSREILDRDARLSSCTFNCKELLLKSKGICYLTGDTIDFSDPKSYELDHRVPKSSGGLNTLDNCELSTRNANRAKFNMSVEEFFDLCVKVVKHNNLKID